MKQKSASVTITDKKRIWLFILVGVTSSVFAMLFFVPIYVTHANLTDEPLGIEEQAEKVSISRYLLGDYKFNEDKDYQTNSFIDNIHSFSTLGFNGKIANPNYIEIENPATHTLNKNFSVGGWIKIDGLGSIHTIITQGNTSQHDFNLYVNSDNLLKLGIRDNSDTYNIYSASVGNELNNNTWYFINVTGEYDNGNNQTEINFYQNNEVTGAFFFSGFAIETPTPSSALNIGVDVDLSKSFRGYIDNIYIANKAFSENQIYAMYNSIGRKLPLQIPFSYFDLFYDFDNQSGTIAVDSSPLHRNGILENYKLSGWFRANENGDTIGAYGLQYDGEDDIVTINTPEDVKTQTEGTIELAFSLNDYPTAPDLSTLLSISNGE